jgi:hypothetical protein
MTSSWPDRKAAWPNRVRSNSSRSAEREGTSVFHRVGLHAEDKTVAQARSSAEKPNRFFRNAAELRSTDV